MVEGGKRLLQGLKTASIHVLEISQRLEITGRQVTFQLAEVEAGRLDAKLVDEPGSPRSESFLPAREVQLFQAVEVGSVAGLPVPVEPCVSLDALPADPACHVESFGLGSGRPSQDPMTSEAPEDSEIFLEPTIGGG